MVFTRSAIERSPVNVVSKNSACQMAMILAFVVDTGRGRYVRWLTSSCPLWQWPLAGSVGLGVHQSATVNVPLGTAWQLHHQVVRVAVVKPHRAGAKLAEEMEPFTRHVE